MSPSLVSLRAALLVSAAAALGACTTVRERPAGAVLKSTLTDDPAKLQVWTLGAIEVRTRDIYSPEEVERSALARLLNATHRRTREVVVQRELWIGPGQPIRGVDAEELERNLRATGLFAEVRATLHPTEQEGVVDLLVETEDRLSLAIGASGSVVGAVSSLGTTVSESNLLGYGDRATIGYSENSDGEFRGVLSYRDRHFLGSWVTASAQVGRTEEGDFASLGLERPFKYLSDDDSWRVNAGTSNSAIDYYEAGASVAEVPQSRDSFETAVFRRYGPAERRWTLGLRARHDAIGVGSARGPAAATIDVPGDADTTFAGFSFGHRRLLGFRKVEALDTLGYIQDLSLSAGFDALIGATYRVEEGESDALQPTFSLGSHVALEPFIDTFVAARIDGSARVEAGEARGWAVGADLTAFELSFAPQTFAAHLAYNEAFEGDALPVQLTLGEDQGLRGYPTREFTGDRVLRLNFEDRIDLHAAIGTFRFGGVVFFDAGWIEDRGEGLGAPLTSTGLGLRIGSDALFGPRVLRIDFSIPLSAFDGERYDPLLSISFGQVFGFE
ncbi:MAG: hypothetical protein R3F49_12380 [Planctomycetota bacterium]